jgi:hypothetical protein
MTNSAETIWRHSPSVAWLPSSEPGEQSVILVATLGKDSAPRTLEGSAAAIWNALDGRKSVKSIADDLCSAYDLPPEEMLAAVQLFLAQLTELRLVQKA